MGSSSDAEFSLLLLPLRDKVGDPAVDNLVFRHDLELQTGWSSQPHSGAIAVLRTNLLLDGVVLALEYIREGAPFALDLVDV